MSKKNKKNIPQPEPKVKRPSVIWRFLKFIWRKKWWILLIACVLVAIKLIFGGTTDKKQEFATVNITRGDLRHVVSATGEIRPVNTVNVGSQVSGTIDNLYVDFNSKVKKGDVLLTIEPSVLQASVNEALASLESAKSQRDLAKSEYERNKYLYEKDYRTVSGRADAGRMLRRLLQAR